MSFARLVQVMLPVLNQKYSNVQEHMAVEAKSMLSTLWTLLEDHASIERTRSADGFLFDALETLLDEVESEGQTSQAHRSDRGFVGVLAAMALRPLLATLAAKVPPEMVALRAHIEAAISIIHGKRGTTHAIVAADFPAAAPVTQFICTAGIPVVAFPLTGAAGATPGLAAQGRGQPRVDGDVGRRPRGFEPLNQRPGCAAY